MLDEMDVKILRILQQDCTRSVADIGKEVGLSTTPCWRRIQKLEEAGVIKRRVAVLDRAAASTPASPCSCRSRPTSTRLAWLERFHAAVVDFPEVVEFYRMSGEVDYLLRVVVPDIAAYDAFYKKLIARIEISKVSSAFAMEQIKYTTALPLDFAMRPSAAEKASAQRPTYAAPADRRAEDIGMTEAGTNIGVPPLERSRRSAASNFCARIVDGTPAAPPITETLGFASPRWRRALHSSR